MKYPPTNSSPERMEQYKFTLVLRTSLHSASGASPTRAKAAVPTSNVEASNRGLFIQHLITSRPLSQPTLFRDITATQKQTKQTKRRRRQRIYNMSGYHPDQSATPPAPPPKPGSHEASRMTTPGTSSSSVPPPPPPQHPGYSSYSTYEPSQLQQVQTMDAEGQVGGSAAQQQLEVPQPMPDPGEGWLPETLQDKPCVLDSPLLPLQFRSYETQY